MKLEKIEVGKQYTLRNGLVTGKISLSKNGTSYIYEAEVDDPKYDTPSICAWTGTGRFITQGVDHSYDIILKEIKDEQNTKNNNS